jgi:uncharacterized membrane protein
MGDQSKKLARQQRRAMERQVADPSPPVPSATYRREFSLEWRYPLPPPSLLEQYGFIKDAPDRILKLWERQARHRQKLENRDSWTEAFQRIFGSIAGFLIGIAGMAGAFYLILQGKPISGFVSLIFPMSVLLSVIQRTKPPTNNSEAPEAEATTPPEQTELPLSSPQ